jgi:hypothetical protein
MLKAIFASHKQVADLNLWLTLAAAFAVVAWWIPVGARPWPSFHRDWLFATSLIPLACWAAWKSWRTKQSWPIPTAVVFVGAISLVPIVQSLTGQIVFAGDAGLVLLALWSMALAIDVGAKWRALRPDAVDFGLPVAIVIAALGAVALGTMQWLGVESLGTLLVALPPGSRPTSNLAQANHFSTLAACGLLATWWLYETRRVHGSAALSLAAFMLFGVAMSQSRTGWLQLAALASVALYLSRRAPGSSSLAPPAQLPAAGLLRLTRASVLLLAAAFVTLVVVWPQLNAGLPQPAGLSLERQASIGSRPAIWLNQWAAVQQAPWLGHGWGQGHLAHQSAVWSQPWPSPLTFAHNLVLDLLVWQGIPLTLLTVGAVLWWARRRASTLRTTGARFCALGLLLLGIHAMLEFPHAYLIFLLPAGLMIGVVESDAMPCAAGASDSGPLPIGLRLRAFMLACAVAAALAVSLLLARDYMRISRSLDQFRFESARFEYVDRSAVPPALLLTQLQSLMEFIRTPGDASLTQQELDRSARVAARFPSSANQLRLALMQAHNGEPKSAAKTLELMCATHRQLECDRALAAWTENIRLSPPRQPVEPPSR